MWYAPPVLAAGNQEDAPLLASAAGILASVRLTIPNADEIRNLKASVMKRAALAASHRLAVLTRMAEQLNNSKTKGQKWHGKGVQEFWAWRAMVHATCEAGDDEAQILKSHIETMTDPKAFKSASAENI